MAAWMDWPDSTTTTVGSLAPALAVTPTTPATSSPPATHANNGRRMCNPPVSRTREA